MFNKKIIIGIIMFCFIGACTSPTAMLGPVYTISSTGNIFQAGLSYGSGEIVTMYTGKTPIENIKEFAEIEKQNIQKKTLESDDFFVLVKNKIEKTSSILKIPTQ
tara:strand:- start:231 stop:545 length:315 start_codon:yes stop_codon:yes gene_type:complete